MTAVRDRLAANLQHVRGRIARAAAASGRPSEAVRLVAVTKQVSAEVARELVSLGVADLGESRPQELWAKHALVGGSVRWHQVGPLQRNKVRRTLPLVSLVHSVDSGGLLQRIDDLAVELGLTADVLLEVNVSGESTKHGFRPADVPAAIQACGSLRRARACGLMTMAPYDSNAERARPVFAALRDLARRLEADAPPNCPLTELSMGMSGDFEVAIEEGATIVRVGSALFAGITTES